MYDDFPHAFPLILLGPTYCGEHRSVSRNTQALTMKFVVKSALQGLLRTKAVLVDSGHDIGLYVTDCQGIAHPSEATKI